MHAAVAIREATGVGSGRVLLPRDTPVTAHSTYSISHVSRETLPPRHDLGQDFGRVSHSDRSRDGDVYCRREREENESACHGDLRTNPSFYHGDVRVGEE